MAVPATITHRDGWYGEEHDGVRLFQWMSRQARCQLSGVSTSGTNWLRLTAGHGWPAGSCPVLTVEVNGRRVGERAIRGQFSDYLFPLHDAGDLDITLALDRTCRVPGDERDLGVMVRAIEVVDLDRVHAPVDAEGWYEWEHHAYFPFRWMGQEARLLVPADVRARGRFAAVPVYAESDNGWQMLALLAGGEVVANLKLFRGWHVYDFAMPALGFDADPQKLLELTFCANRLLPATFHESDPRELSVGVGALEVHDDARRHEKARVFQEWGFAGSGDELPRPPGGRQAVGLVMAPSTDGSESYQAQDGEGWHGWEFQDPIPFQWMKREARITVPERVVGQRRFCVVPAYSDYRNLAQVLTITANGRVLVEQPLAHTWNYYSFALPVASSGSLEMSFALNKVIPAAHHPDDPRELGARLGPLTFHDDEQRHERARFFLENAILNAREMQSGATVLTSFPPSLGIDLYGKCNIKPPCVYCLWDFTKGFEGEDVNTVVDDRTLDGYGRFFDAARVVVNCSFGEPLLHPRLEEILDLLGRHNKVAEISTNGQVFTPAVVRTLAGRSVLLYVSLDAASAEVYGRLRNDRWHEVVSGLTFLREARRRANRLPKVYMVFMPMRANLHELEAYFRLCRMVEADALMLRPLNFVENAAIQQDRGGYHFDYSQEWLGQDEIRAVSLQCEEYGQRYEVTVHNQFEFGLPKPAAERRKGRKTS